RGIPVREPVLPVLGRRGTRVPGLARGDREVVQRILLPGRAADRTEPAAGGGDAAGLLASRVDRPSGRGPGHVPGGAGVLPDPLRVGPHAGGGTEPLDRTGAERADSVEARPFLRGDRTGRADPAAADRGGGAAGEAERPGRARAGHLGGDAGDAA